jgi:hypothetical protein
MSPISSYASFSSPSSLSSLGRYVNAWFHVSHAMLVPTAEQISAYSYDDACRLGAINSNQTTCAHQIFWSSQHAADAAIGDLTDGLRARGLWTKVVGCAGVFLMLCVAVAMWSGPTCSCCVVVVVCSRACRLACCRVVCGHIVVWPHVFLVYGRGRL